MKRFFVTICVIALCAVWGSAVLQAASGVGRKIYINPGHGSWGPNDRPMATISYPMLSTGRPDTCGFYESNTNLWKCTYLAKKLQKDGYTIKMSRYFSGPYPYVSGASDESKYNRSLSVICTEVDNWGGDMFLSVHSNATTDGSLTNYPLFLYRGTDKSENVTGSKAMCQSLWPYLVEHMKAGLEYQSHYTSSTNIRGDVDFYHSSSSYGYLGVLKHSTPGFLSEGYFHTYHPARHRALNKDFCYQEGLRYYRGIVKHFGTKADTKGYIMGTVKDKSQSVDHQYYKYKEGTNDQYLPIMGATVRLRSEMGKEIGQYKTDQNWNGIFVFYDLEPGIYYIDLKADGYETQQLKTNVVTVKANQTTYPLLFMTKGKSTEFIPAIDLDDETIPHIATIKVTGGGSVICNGKEFRDTTVKDTVYNGKPAVLQFKTDEGGKRLTVALNGTAISSKIQNDTYTIDKVYEDFSLVATYKKISTGIQNISQDETSDADEEVLIYDFNGKLIKRMSAAEWDSYDLPRGTYIMQQGNRTMKVFN